MPPSPISQITEAHENRLQRLEEGVKEVAITAATTVQKLDHLGEKIDDGFKGLHGRLDVTTNHLELQASEIAALKLIEASRATRWGVVKKAVIPLMAGGAGVIATKTGEGVWAWLVRLLG